MTINQANICVFFEYWELLYLYLFFFYSGFYMCIIYFISINKL